MAAPSAQTLQRLADETGHQPGTLEKVLRLRDLLQEIARGSGSGGSSRPQGWDGAQPVLPRSRPALGRYRPDYVGALDRAAMEAERPTSTPRSTVSSPPRDTVFAAGPASMPEASGWPATPRRSAATPRWKSTSTTWHASHCSAWRAWVSPLGGIPAANRRDRHDPADAAGRAELLFLPGLRRRDRSAGGSASSSKASPATSRPRSSPSTSTMLSTLATS